MPFNYDLLEYSLVAVSRALIYVDSGIVNYLAQSRACYNVGGLQREKLYTGISIILLHNYIVHLS